MRNYYVYGLIDPVTFLPFYIGKGKGKRAESHMKLTKNDTYNSRKRQHIIDILNEGKTIDIIYYYRDLSNDEANKYEKLLIAKYGRKDFDKNGILLNLTLGGEGGDMSSFFTDQSRKKISDRVNGTSNPMSKLNEQQVVEIYHAIKSIKELAVLYNISQTQILFIKNKKSYKNITKDINELPGASVGKTLTRVIIPADIVKKIFLDSGTFEYFAKKYKTTNVTLKSIKSKKTYKSITENLGEPGEIITYKLSNTDINNIKQSNLSLTELAKK